MKAPWDKPRIKRVLELFGGRVVKINTNTNSIRREVKTDEAEIHR